MDDNIVWPIAAVVLGALLFVIILTDTFETVILPRGVTRGAGLARLFYGWMWRLWVGLSGLAGKRKEGFLSAFGPVSLPLLLSVWALGLILSFALVIWGVSGLLHASGQRQFLVELYMSGSTFFTLGLGDVAPRDGITKLLVVVEAGVGFGFLALVIGYLPVLYSAFSRRETHISLLDARASSPPTAGELLRRYGLANATDRLPVLLEGWEMWSAELMESHLSYPVLTYYRSQHDRQSWVAAMTTILDTCALIKIGIKDIPAWQAHLTFAMARHAIVDLAHILKVAPKQPTSDRLPPEELARLREALAEAGLPLLSSNVEEELAGVRSLYEPYVFALAEYLVFDLPPWILPFAAVDDWQTTAWDAEGHF